ncbi:MAG: thermonuclease family protein [Candidatus Latescibacterota bacterium]
MKWMTEGFRGFSLLALLACYCISSGCGGNYPPGVHPTERGAKYIFKDRIIFDDGDTIAYGGEYIRFLGVDTPEVIDSSLGFFENQPYGPEASESTKTWIRRAELVEYLPDGKDVYGRRLAHILVDGELLGVRLVRCGLAYETVTQYGDSGFPKQAKQILDAARDAPTPRFQKPYNWRKKQRKNLERSGK